MGCAQLGSCHASHVHAQDVALNKLDQRVAFHMCKQVFDNHVLLQLQGLLDMLSLGHVEGDEPSPSKLSFTDLGRLHISEGRALLLADARARVGQWKLYRICEALTRFHFGERGISSQHARSDHRQSPNTNLFTSLTADLRHVSAFSLHKEYLGHQTETMGYPWSALSEPEGYSGSWKLADIAKSPSLVEIDADEFVHLVYTYAALFQTEMEARGLRLTSTVCFDHMYRGFFSVSVEPIIGVSA